MTTFNTKEDYLAFRSTWATAAQKKVLTAEHHVLYNILRGKPFHRGFTLISNHNKLMNGTAINGGLHDACYKLRCVATDAVAIACNMNYTSYMERRVQRFLLPFGDTLTIEQLSDITVPEFQKWEPTYSKGERMARAIIAGEFAPVTNDDLEEWNDD